MSKTMIFLFILLLVVAMLGALVLLYCLIIKYENYAYKRDKRILKKKHAKKYFQYMLKTMHRK